MIPYTTLETLTFVREQDRVREWKMAALAAQLPRTSHPGYREHLAHGLRVVARYLDPDLSVPAERSSAERTSAERTASAAL